MGLAPTPVPIAGGYAETSGARQFMRIRVKERTLELVPDLTMSERFVVRAATGLPFEAFFPEEQQREFGQDSFFVCWWVARRQSGEPNLPFRQAQAEWPKLEEGDIEAALVNLDDEPMAEDSPEGSGPAS